MSEGNAHVSQTPRTPIDKAIDAGPMQPLSDLLRCTHGELFDACHRGRQEDAEGLHGHRGGPLSGAKLFGSGERGTTARVKGELRFNMFQDYKMPFGFLVD